MKKVIETIIYDDTKSGDKKNSNQDRMVNNSTMITFKEFLKSIKNMAIFTLESSSEVAAGEKIRAFIKHINVNCQYNYNVNNLISENSSTPVKNNAHKSFSSVCDNSTDDQIQNAMNFSNNIHQSENDEIERYSVPIPNPNRIDDNIDKALKALKSPRLSVPGSSEKHSKRASSRHKQVDDRSSDQLEIFSNPVQSYNPNLRQISSPMNRRSRSPSILSQNAKEDHTELREFLEIEKSCQALESLRNAVSANMSPSKNVESPKFKSQKHSLEKEKPESRNDGISHKPKRSTLEKVKDGSDLFDKSIKFKIEAMRKSAVANLV